MLSQRQILTHRAEAFPAANLTQSCERKSCTINQPTVKKSDEIYWGRPRAVATSLSAESWRRVQSQQFSPKLVLATFCREHGITALNTN
jgi:hypothetical protein